MSKRKPYGNVRFGRNTIFPVITVALVVVVGVYAIFRSNAATNTPRGVTSESSPFVSTAKKCYRIPAVVRDKSGNTYAFAERRFGNGKNSPCSDFGDIDIVMRKLPSGGKWSSEVVIANKGTDRVTNPVPIYNEFTNKIHLIYSYKDNVANRTIGMYMKTSSDSGRSWSGMTANASNLVMKSSTLSGPGHGIVIKQGKYKGRMIFATGAGAIYSSDNGNTWKKGFALEPGLIEGTITEIGVNKLLACYRVKDESIKRSHRCAISTDGGWSISSFSSIKYNTPLTVSIEGSLLTLAGGKYNGYVLYSTPSNATTRKGMSIFASKVTNADPPVSFQIKKWFRVTSPDIGAAYSDMVQVNSSSVGVLYETGSNPKGPYDKIKYSVVSIPSIMNAAGY